MVDVALERQEGDHDADAAPVLWTNNVLLQPGYQRRRLWNQEDATHILRKNTPALECFDRRVERQEKGRKPVR